MTLPKKPLPPLRFVIYAQQTFELIPHTDNKGRVTAGYWCVPGGEIRTTKELSDHCKANGWRHAIVGDEGTTISKSL